MALAFRTATVRFDPTRGRIQVEPGSANFGRNIRTAACALNGFHVKYTEGDHHVWQQTIDIQNVRIAGQVVDFEVRLLLRDSSGNIDDRFDGLVDVLVIADLV